MPEVDASVLWQHWHDEMQAFVRSRLRSDAAAQDLLQTAFLKAHESLVRGAVPTHPRAWLYQIVRNLITDAHRQSSKRHALSAAAAVEASSSYELRLEEETSAAVARMLPRLVDALPPPYRDAVRMTELEGLTLAEAADRAGISLSGMKSRVQRGRRQLFGALERCCRLELDGRGRVVACTSRASGDDCC